jgi:hypothetical protein
MNGGNGELPPNGLGAMRVEVEALRARVNHSDAVLTARLDELGETVLMHSRAISAELVNVGNALKNNTHRLGELETLAAAVLNTLEQMQQQLKRPRAAKGKKP